jgi:hypothetical protein
MPEHTAEDRLRKLFKKHLEEAEKKRQGDEDRVKGLFRDALAKPAFDPGVSDLGVSTPAILPGAGRKPEKGIAERLIGKTGLKALDIADIGARISFEGAVLGAQSVFSQNPPGVVATGSSADRLQKGRAEFERTQGRKPNLLETADISAQVNPLPIGVRPLGRALVDPLNPFLLGAGAAVRGVRTALRGATPKVVDVSKMARAVSPSAPLPTAPQIMGDLSDFNETVGLMTRPDIWRRIANAPVIRSIMGRFNPSAVANDSVRQSLVGRAVLRDQGNQLSAVATARLGAIGTQGQVFGKLTAEGLIADGPLKGVTVNTVRSNPGQFAGKLTPEMDEWVRVADDIERAKLDFLKKNGIEINELTFEEGGQYAGRRVWGRANSEGEVLDVAHIGAGPGRPGSKLASEKVRVFKTTEEAIEEGYRYIPDDEALFLNVQGAYNRVADKRMADWLLDRVDWRTLTTPEGVKVAREAAQRRLALANRSIDALQRAIRGETLPTGTVNAIERLFPQLEGRLREPTRVRVADVLKAAKKLEQPERVLEVPKIGTIRKVAKLLEEAQAALAANPGNPALQAEVSRLRSSLGFIRYRIGVGEPITLPHNVTKALRADAIKDLRELLDAIRGTRVIRPGQVGPRFEGGLIAEVRKEVAETLKKAAAARQEAARIKKAEGVVQAPAFAGKVFKKEIADILTESMEPGFSKALGALNQVNAVSRYFMLAGDVSPMMIQLLYLAGGNPKVYAKAGRGFLQALTDTRFQARYLAQPENAAIIQKYPGIKLIQGGANEFTEATARGGLLTAERAVLPAGESLVKKAALLAPRAIGATLGRVIKPFARGFEGAMDVAGIEMAKALDHLGTTAARRADLAQFINNFRGVTSSARLGVSVGQRQLETAALLAPQYNRAIAGILFDTVHGGLRGDLARKSLARGVAAVTAAGVAISYAMGESKEEILRHMNPADPTFMTWKIGNQNIGPGTKIRSVMRLFALSASDPGKLRDRSIGWGELEYMRNPMIKFARGLSSPAVSGGWDLLTGKDFIGDPTTDGVLSFSETIAKRFMFIWAQTAIFDGGTPLDRTARGIAEFLGLRGSPRNRIFEVFDKWQPDLKEYLAIPTDPLERRAKQINVDREQYRKARPHVDARLWITGRVTSLKSGAAAAIVIQLVRENSIDPNEIKAVKKYLELQKRMAQLGVTQGPSSLEQRRVRRLIKDYLLPQAQGVR